MTALRAPRFYGDDRLAVCLEGQLLSQSPTKLDSVATIQHALNDRGASPVLAVDGVFRPSTAAAVEAYQSKAGLVPVDGVIGPVTMAALDDDFALELFERKASKPPEGFPVGSLSGDRVDENEAFARCDSTNGVCVELAHAIVFFLPKEVWNAWDAAGGFGGIYGLPLDDPRQDPTASEPGRSYQQFENVTYVFGLSSAPSFALPRAVWEASLAGRVLVGRPLGPPEPFGPDPTVRKSAHETGVVLLMADEIPRALTDDVFKAWQASVDDGKPLGRPSGSAYLAADGTSVRFPFENGIV